MKVKTITSFNRNIRGRGDVAVVNIDLEPEGEIEIALMRVLRSGTKEFHISTHGTAYAQIKMPRGKW